MTGGTNNNYTTHTAWEKKSLTRLWKSVVLVSGTSLCVTGTSFCNVPQIL